MRVLYMYTRFLYIPKVNPNITWNTCIKKMWIWIGIGIRSVTKMMEWNIFPIHVDYF
jgi:hypothetical protein